MSILEKLLAINCTTATLNHFYMGVLGQFFMGKTESLQHPFHYCKAKPLAHQVEYTFIFCLLLFHWQMLILSKASPSSFSQFRIKDWYPYLLHFSSAVFLNAQLLAYHQNQSFHCYEQLSILQTQAWHLSHHLQNQELCPLFFLLNNYLILHIQRKYALDCNQCSWSLELLKENLQHFLALLYWILIGLSE